MIEYSKQIQNAVEQNTTKEVQEVEEAIKKLNEKVEKIMETDYVKERQQKIGAAQLQMMKSIKEASNTFFQVRNVIRSKENLTAEEKFQYEENYFIKFLINL